MVPSISDFLISDSFPKDVTDLFGTDLPVEGGKGGEFAWRDGPLLAALKAGHWIVLDEVSSVFCNKENSFSYLENGCCLIRVPAPNFILMLLCEPLKNSEIFFNGGGTPEIASGG